MTHQTLSLGKYWKLFRATLSADEIIRVISKSNERAPPAPKRSNLLQIVLANLSSKQVHYIVKGINFVPF